MGKALKRLMFVLLALALAMAFWTATSWVIGYATDRVFGLVDDRYIAFGSAVLVLSNSISLCFIVVSVTVMNHVRGKVSGAIKTP